MGSNVPPRAAYLCSPELSMAAHIGSCCRHSSRPSGGCMPGRSGCTDPQDTDCTPQKPVKIYCREGAPQRHGASGLTRGRRCLLYHEESSPARCGLSQSVYVREPCKILYRLGQNFVGEVPVDRRATLGISLKLIDPRGSIFSKGRAGSEPLAALWSLPPSRWS